MKRFVLLAVFTSLLVINQSSSQSKITGEFIFKPDKQKHGHTHASSIVECPNGDLLVCWYEGETDKSRDVHIQAARLKKNSDNWTETFLLADTPMLSDNNPVLFIDQQKKLWLLYYTLLGAPEEAWHTAFLRFKISTKYTSEGKPIVWEVERDLPVIPNQLDNIVKRICEMMLQRTQHDSSVVEICHRAQEKLKSQLARRLGWTIRAHPLLLSSGELLLPMAHEIFGVAAMAITKDDGNTWRFSQSPLGYGVEQPSVFERKDGTLLAFFRDASDIHRIRKSESFDCGFSWTTIETTEFLNPGAGIEVLRLASGNVVLIYNDCEASPRNSLAISMSDDEGKTWKWKRHLENAAGQARFDYPSIVQAQNGKIHVTYSYNVETIKHVVFDEEWIKKDLE